MSTPLLRGSDYRVTSWCCGRCRSEAPTIRGVAGTWCQVLTLGLQVRAYPGVCMGTAANKALGLPSGAMAGRARPGGPRGHEPARPPSGPAPSQCRKRCVEYVRRLRPASGGGDPRPCTRNHPARSRGLRARGGPGPAATATTWLDRRTSTTRGNPDASRQGQSPKPRSRAGRFRRTHRPLAELRPLKSLHAPARSQDRTSPSRHQQASAAASWGSWGYSLARLSPDPAAHSETPPCQSTNRPQAPVALSNS
jgi:hypothetical protein